MSTLTSKTKRRAGAKASKKMERYIKLIDIAKGYGYFETAFKVPLEDLATVVTGLEKMGCTVIGLDPISNKNYVGKPVGIDYQRVLVDWRG